MEAMHGCKKLKNDHNYHSSTLLTTTAVADTTVTDHTYIRKLEERTSLQGAAAAVTSSSSENSDSDTDALEIDIPCVSSRVPGSAIVSPTSPLSSDSALHELSEDDVISPAPPAPSSSFRYICAQDRLSHISAEAATPPSFPSCSGINPCSSSSSEYSESRSQEEEEGVYLEQRDHTYLSKKQLQYIAPRPPPRPRFSRQGISELQTNQRPESSSCVLSVGSFVPVVSDSATTIPRQDLDVDKPNEAAKDNPAVFQEHGYGMNLAEEQQENIRRDHSYGYSEVPKGRKLSKLRKTMRANTQSTDLDHAYEPVAKK